MSNSIPEDWSIAPIGDICNIAIGGTPSRSIPDYWDSTRTVGSPWVSIRDLNKPWIYETSEWITDAGIKNSNVKLVRKGTVIMSFKLSVGRVAFAGRDLYTNEAIAAFLPKRNNVYSDQFLYQGLQHWNLLENIDQAVKGVTLNKQKINQIDTVLPPLPEQQKIAAILSSVDDVIEKTRAQIDKLKDLKTGMMQELLTKGIGHTEFKDSPVGRIPSSWACLELSDYISIGRGFAFKSGDYRDSGRAILRVTNIARNGEIDLSSNVMHIDPDEATKYKPYELRQGDILIVMVGATVGKLAVVPAHCENFLLNQNMWRLTVKDFQLYDQTFAYYALSPVIERFLSRQQGSARGFLTQKDFSQELIAMPPMHEQIILSGMISSVDDKLRSQRAIYAQLKNLKKALMQDLLTGKVRVKVDQKESAVA